MNEIYILLKGIKWKIRAYWDGSINKSINCRGVEQDQEYKFLCLGGIGMTECGVHLPYGKRFGNYRSIGSIVK